MRKLITWLAVTLGIAALIRKFRRRSAAAEGAHVRSPGDDPAAELRQKLAESRAGAEAAAVTATAETPAAAVDERRAEVHEEGRAALEEMRSAGDDA